MSGLFGGGTTVVQPAPPTPQAPAPLPDPNSPAALQARRNAQNKLLSQAGRSSTILTTAANRGGQARQAGTLAGSGGAYSNATLGGGS
jgi:hypothetical protein